MPPRTCLGEKAFEILHGPEASWDRMIACRVVLGFVRRSGLGSSEHKSRHAQSLKVVQLFGEPREVAYPVMVTVVE